MVIPGTEGYAEQAEELIERYEAPSFAAKHQAILHLLPVTPGRVLDIGAGTGSDAAWLSSQGHTVVAVEPTDAFRQFGMARYASRSIEWINDGLPALTAVLARSQTFNAVMLTAVWMHLDQPERQVAMRNVVSLLAPGGMLIMSLRHGPAPAGRRMFEVSAEETVALAQACGLRSVLTARTASVQPFNRDAGVTWTSLAFAN